MPIPTIHGGYTHFAHGRLQAQINSKGTWMLMEACNKSARTHKQVDLEALAAKMLK